MDRLIQSPLWRVKIRNNYRQHYDQPIVDAIASSIQTNGFKIEYPLTCYAVDDSYILIDGHTRYTACLQLNNRSLPVYIVLKDKPSDKDFKLSQLSANELRKSPDDISKAIGYKQALDYGATMEEVMRDTGRRKDYIEDRLSLLTLVSEAQDLVAKKHLGIKFAAQLTRLDSNFQRIALKAYNAMKSPTLDEFTAIVNDLYTKQAQSSLFDFALFVGKPIEELIDAIQIERQKSRAELLAEVDALKQARELDRQFARTKFQAALKEIERLKRQLNTASNLQKAG